MYEAHPYLETPPDDTVIWRYIDLERLLALLCYGSLYLCRLDHLRDPWEGVWPPAVLEAIRVDLESVHAGSAGGFVRFANEVRKSFFVSCWHENSCESAAFWDQYGNSRGFAVRSTIGRLKESSRSAAGFFVGRVHYLDYDNPTRIGESFNALTPAFTKRRSFEHEREVRVLIWSLPETDKHLDWSTLKESCDLPVDLAVLIDSIFISPASPRWLLDPVRELLRRFSLPDVRVQRSELYDGSVT